MNTAHAPIQIDYTERNNVNDDEAFTLALIFECAINLLRPTLFYIACSDTHHFAEHLNGRKTYEFFFDLRCDRINGRDRWEADFSNPTQRFFIRGYLSPDLD